MWVHLVYIIRFWTTSHFLLQMIPAHYWDKYCTFVALVYLFTIITSFMLHQSQSGAFQNQLGFIGTYSDAWKCWILVPIIDQKWLAFNLRYTVLHTVCWYHIKHEFYKIQSFWFMFLIKNKSITTLIQISSHWLVSH